MPAKRVAKERRLLWWPARRPWFYRSSQVRWGEGGPSTAG